MVVLNKKRILLIIFTVIIAVLTPALKEETKETVALPVSNKVIVLDSGHRNTR